jgi:tetratricopeptide (TPR) repeat protein
MSISIARRYNSEPSGSLPLVGRAGEGVVARAAFFVAFLAIAVSTAQAQAPNDRIHRLNGVDSGKITATTPLGVTIAKGSVESTVPAEDIESITFAGEPPELATARNALQSGRPKDAADALAKIQPGSVQREEIQADVDFYSMLAKAQLALAGQGAPDAVATDVRAFMARRNKSFHIPQAIELLGDLLAASGEYPNARNEYAKLAKAKTPYFELRSALLVGKAWQAEGDHAKALPEFEKVLATTEQSPAIEQMKLDATLGRAISQAATGKGDQSAAAIGEIIAKAKPENNKLLARAYNALGDCYLKSGDNRAALFSFLHVDLLYNQDADAHAKALHELIPLWKSVGRDTRSQQAAQELQQKYPASRWAKQ